MKEIFAIFQKELQTSYYSLIAYIVIGLFTAIAGYFFFNQLSYFVEMAFRETMMAQQYRMQPRPMNVNLMMVRPFFGVLATISLFFLPIITMRLYSEEKRLGTVELLYTTPITPVQIIIGKFLSGVALYVVLLIPSMFFQILLFVYGDPEFWPIFSGYLGLILMGSAFISIGLFISTTTENQIISAIGGFALLLILWVIGFSANFVGSTFGSILSYLSIINHFEDFSQGVIDTSHVAYYLLFISVGIYFSTKMIESVKWRA